MQPQAKPADNSQADIEALYDSLMANSKATPVDDILAKVLASWVYGKGALPKYLGMSEAAFSAMLEQRFQGFDLNGYDLPREGLEAERLDERDEVIKLLLGHRAATDESEEWLAEIVTAACQGSDHLWQDLGLWSRTDLSTLMDLGFPSLAAKNDKDMKWKKFIYKQLCITEGIYTCRAPSCEVCADYAVCFGPEE